MYSKIKILMNTVFLCVFLFLTLVTKVAFAEKCPVAIPVHVINNFPREVEYKFNKNDYFEAPYIDAYIHEGGDQKFDTKFLAAGEYGFLNTLFRIGQQDIALVSLVCIGDSSKEGDRCWTGQFSCSTLIDQRARWDDPNAGKFTIIRSPEKFSDDPGITITVLKNGSST